MNLNDNPTPELEFHRHFTDNGFLNGTSFEKDGFVHIDDLSFSDFFDESYKNFENVFFINMDLIKENIKLEEIRKYGKWLYEVYQNLINQKQILFVYTTIIQKNKFYTVGVFQPLLNFYDDTYILEKINGKYIIADITGE